MKRSHAPAFLGVAFAAVVATGWAALPTTARATDLTAATQVVARVGGSCAVAATDLDFGTLTASLSGGVSQTDANGTVSITCNTNIAFSVVVNRGTYSTGFDRRMQSASGTTNMTYDIYTTAARTTSYPATGTTQSYTSDGNPLAITSYGRIPAQTLTGVGLVGAYTDVLTWSVTY
jgi:spore coat protein U-like protein